MRAMDVEEQKEVEQPRNLNPNLEDMGIHKEEKK